MTDSELDELIRQSQAVPEFDPSFQREIWARIATVEPTSWSARWSRWSETLLGPLANPAPALATVMVMLLLGAGLGRIVPYPSAADEARQAYLSSINPLLASDPSTAE